MYSSWNNNEGILISNLEPFISINVGLCVISGLLLHEDTLSPLSVQLISSTDIYWASGAPGTIRGVLKGTGGPAFRELTFLWGETGKEARGFQNVPSATKEVTRWNGNSGGQGCGRSMMASVRKVCLNWDLKD